MNDFKKKLIKLAEIEGVVAIDTESKELTLLEGALQEVSGLLGEDFKGWTINIAPSPSPVIPPFGLSWKNILKIISYERL